MSFFVFFTQKKSNESRFALYIHLVLKINQQALKKKKKKRVYI